MTYVNISSKPFIFVQKKNTRMKKQNRFVAQMYLHEANKYPSRKSIAYLVVM